MGEDLKINVWTKQDMFRKIFRKIGGSSKDCQMAKELKKTLAIRMTVAIISMSLLDLQSWICVKTMHLLSCLHSHFWVNTTNFQLFQKQYSNQSPRFLECYLSFQKSWFIYYCTTYQYKYTYYIYIYVKIHVNIYEDIWSVTKNHAIKPRKKTILAGYFFHETTNLGGGIYIYVILWPY